MALVGPEHSRVARRLRRRRRRAVRRWLAGAGFCVLVAGTLVVAVGGGSPRGPVRAVAGATTADRTVRAMSRDGARPRTWAVRRVGSVPILMYHVINSPPAGAPFPGLYVTPRAFAAQMRALAAAGFTGVTLDRVDANWRRGAPLAAARPIVISFDNGYRTQYTRAFPILRRLGWPAVENLQLQGLPPVQGGLTQREIRALVRAGWELDTQGFSHADLVRAGPERLWHEVVAARTVMQRRFGVPVNWFCYPSGLYDAAVVAAVKAAGYVGSTTVVAGWATSRDDRYRLPRLRVLAGTAPAALLGLLGASRTDPAPPPSYG